MSDERERGDEGFAEGVPQVPGHAAEIDITDGALAAATASPAGDVAEDAAHGTAMEPEGYGDDADPGETAYDADPGEPAYDAGPAETAYDAGPDPRAGLDAAAPPLRKIIESILLVVDQPVAEVELAQVLEEPRATVLGALEDLAAEYLRDGRGFELRQVAGGWRLYTAPDCAAYVERFVLDGQQARLTQAALETLAVTAYRQPVSRQSVAAIRGVNVDGVVRTLLSRGLIAEAGEEGPGGAHLYVTTPYFLERLGLNSLDELPNLAPLLPANVDDLSDSA